MTAVPQFGKLAIGVPDQVSLVPSTDLRAATKAAFAVEFGRFLDQTDDIVKPEKLFGLVCDFALNFDCPWIAYGSLTPNQKCLKPVRRMLNYPEEWQQRYLEMRYDKIDPIFRTSRNRTGAFRWSEVYNDSRTTEDERRVFDEAATFGLKSGISIPLHRSDGSLAVVSFAHVHDQEFEHTTVTYLALVALHFHLRIADFANSIGAEEPVILSQREKECISWVARGKSSWEIGKILHISDNTVNFHIKNVLKKLESSNRTVAAIKATNIGIIDY
ncbi:LuxR family transcriptional regulator [Mesorhizobium caraganae]|uniref:LuxR family transcriptional regulator n=1 Tax=Mesorhizobium caraganae TaxID=483206 RepID=UPI001FF063DA|nr:LuxR family transcriptional regulator [Mesorhizobium caraganae]